MDGLDGMRFVAHVSRHPWGSTVNVTESRGLAYARLYGYGNGCACVEGLNVDEGCRGRGIGTGLLGMLERYAAERLGARRMLLSVWRGEPETGRLLAWYSGMGYSPARPGDGGPDMSDPGMAWLAKDIGR